MTYSKQTWVDNTTPVDASHMSHIEDGIGTADGKPNYLGDWVAGAYNDGDIVVYNGLLYQAVRPTSNAPVAWPAPPGQVFTPSPATTDWVPIYQIGPTVPYGTTLPASPVDGQEAILVDSLTNPSFQWRFRYNAASSQTWKWEFVGGPPLATYSGMTNGLTSANGWFNLSSGPVLAVPRAGQYLVRYGCFCQNGGGWTVAANIECRVLFATTGVSNPATTIALAAWSGNNVFATQPFNLVAGETGTLQIHNAGPDASNFNNGYLELVARRVS